MNAKSGGSAGLNARKLIAVSILFLLFPVSELPLWRLEQPQTTVTLSEVDGLRGCLNGTVTLHPVRARVAFLVPIFTLTPYDNWDTSFYSFYTKHRGAVGPITTDLGMLRTKAVTNFTFARNLNEQSFYDLLHEFLGSPKAARCGLILGSNLHLTDDVAVDGGALFSGSARSYDVLIMGHEEYVTRSEYDQLREFVATGGRLVAMSGNTFWAEVNYDRTTQVETFVAGHGFRFDGAKAWRTSYEPFDAESAGWFGSTFANGIWTLRGAVLQRSGEFGSALAQALHSSLAFTDYSYPHDEVNSVRNWTGTEVVASFYEGAYTKDGKEHFVIPPLPVDAYTHKFRQGEVFCIGIFGEDIISRDLGAQFFLAYAATHGLPRA